MSDRNSDLSAFGPQLPGGHADSGSDDHAKSQSATQKGGVTSREKQPVTTASNRNCTENKFRSDKSGAHNDGKPNGEHDSGGGDGDARDPWPAERICGLTASDFRAKAVQ